jgi:hypothetical protein
MWMVSYGRLARNFFGKSYWVFFKFSYTENLKPGKHLLHKFQQMSH